jgi:hypothetical protein
LIAGESVTVPNRSLILSDRNTVAATHTTAIVATIRAYSTIV